MKLDVSVKNLGQIKEATFNIRPMTVITGPNGTGKSFFTKSLYSILNVFNRNVFHEELLKIIQKIQLQLDTLIEIRDQEAKNIDVIKEVKAELENLKIKFEQIRSWDIKSYLTFAASKAANVEKMFDDISRDLLEDTKTKYYWLKNIDDGIDLNFKLFLLQIKNSEEYYNEFCLGHIKNELKDNFQISDLGELINFKELSSEIKVDKHLSIQITHEQFTCAFTDDFINEVSGLSSVVFFESPAYWKVRDALKLAKNNPNSRALIAVKNDDALTGTPKYFYDLDDALTIKTKTEGAFKSATDILEKELGGEFIFKGDNLSFKDKSGREISKHLVSFGMTNLGMIQALLKHNVITEGSFIFIDEPETNLHPDWQVKLAEVLLVLAQGGVNIVITTHSSDFVKALEVKIKKLHIEVMEDFLSVHFVDVDGKLLEFKSSDQLEQLIEARSLLNMAYEELYFSDL